MGLSESLEKILQNSNGQLSLQKVHEVFGEKYALQTIEEFLNNEKNLISFDGETITLLKYPIQYFIKILEDFIANTGANRKDVFFSGACYLYIRRQFPDYNFSEIQKYDFFKEYTDFDYQNFLDLFSTSLLFSDTFLNAMNFFFETGWIEKLDSKSFYLFSQEFYEYFLYSSIGGRDLFTTPTTLVQLICRIIPTDRPLKVYNPAAGILKLLTAIKVNSNFEITAVASELSQKIYKIGQLFAKTNGFELCYTNQDSLDELDHINSFEFDLAISIPPFMAKVNKHERHNIAYNDLALNIITGTIKKLRKDGIAIFLVPDGLLFGHSQECKRFRHEIIESRLIHTIVSLPVYLFAPTASVKSSLLIFRNGTDHQSVRFINASANEFYSITKEKLLNLDIDRIAKLIVISSQFDQHEESQTLNGIPDYVDVEFYQLREKNFSLNINDFFIKYIQPQEFGYTELGEIATQVKLPSNNGFDLPYLRITDLNGGILDEKNLHFINKSRTKGRVLSESMILIGTVGGSSKPSWYKSDNTVEISTNIVAFRSDPHRVKNEYLLQELNSTYVQNQMDFLAVGSTSLKHLRLEDLLRIRIKLPSLEEQSRIYHERNEFIQQQSLTKEKKLGTITDADIFKAINHEIGNILKGPQGFIDLLPDFLASNNISLDKPIVNIKNASSIGEMIVMADKKIKNVYEVMQNMKGILFSEKKYFKTETTELKKYFRDKFKSEIVHRDVNFYIGIANDFVNPTSIYAEIDPDQFQYIIRNLVTNAINHSGISFSQGQPLNLFVDIYSLGNGIEIHFMNNGNNFPTDFTIQNFLGFNKKTGDSAGQGLGGYLIGRVVENHSAKIRIQSEKRIIEVLKTGKIISLESDVDIVITIPKTQ